MKYVNLIGIGWMAFWVGRAVEVVGRAPEPRTEPANWGLPVAVLVLMLVPYLAGRFARSGGEKP